MFFSSSCIDTTSAGGPYRASWNSLAADSSSRVNVSSSQPHSRSLSLTRHRHSRQVLLGPRRWSPNMCPNMQGLPKKTSDDMEVSASRQKKLPLFSFLQLEVRNGPLDAHAAAELAVLETEGSTKNT